jgi:hypothetical protein
MVIKYNKEVLNMSFLSKIYVDYTDEEAIKRACSQLGFSTGKYGEYQLSINEDYLTACGTPVYNKGYFGRLLFVIDNYGTMYYYQLRPEIKQFKQVYSVELVKIQLEKKGLPYQTIKFGDGKIKVVAETKRIRI